MSVQVEKVSKFYGKQKALNEISFTLKPGEICGFLGPNGAGKSTLIKMITKEEQPDSGKIIIGGIDLDYVKKRHIPHYRRRLGVVFQDYKLLPMRTVYENVAFALATVFLHQQEVEHINWL